MKLKSIRRYAAIFLVNRIYVGTKCYERKRRLLNKIGHTIGKGTKIVGPVFCTGTLTVGKDCWIGRNLTVHGNGAVIIGNACDIAPDVTFLTGGHALGTHQRRAGAGEIYTIEIEDGCWIGARATIGKNSKIGKGSAVAACACVMKDVHENTLVGGVPAKEIRKLDS